MSDVIPTDEDERVARAILTDDSGKYSSEKIANETARHRRVLMQSTADISDMKRCIKGDEATGYEGMQSKLDETHVMLCEMYKKETGKEPTTNRHKGSDGSALEKSQIDKYVYIGIGILITLVFLIPIAVTIWLAFRGDG